MSSKTKRALLIGINEYPNFPRHQLYGCVNDVAVMADILQRCYGFPNEEMIILKDAEATRDAILKAMNQLAAETGEDDIVVVHYSGHGSQVTDREGDEPDGMDETIVPYDSGREPDENRDITDDEIYEWLLKLCGKTANVTLIFDCCHSGTITRDPFGTGARRVEPDRRPICQLPPSPVTFTRDRENRREIGASGWLPLSNKYVLIAGCRDEESAYEYRINHDGKSLLLGTLTYYLALELATAGTGSSYRDLFERVSAFVTAAKPRQHPQLEGAGDREVFGIRDIVPMQYILVTDRIGSRVHLNAGAAHGMVAGSTWTVYAQGIKNVTDETPRLGTVEITDVQAVSAIGNIVEEHVPGAISGTCRAVESDHYYRLQPFSVTIQYPQGFDYPATELRKAVINSPRLCYTDDEQNADAKACILSPRSAVQPGDPVPQVQSVDDAAWAVVDTTGRLLMPLHTLSEQGVVAILISNFEKLARFRQTLQLVNPDPENVIKGKVTVTLQQLVDGKWINAPIDQNYGMPVFRDGERLGITITNHYSKPVYINILDFGLNKKISLFFPNNNTGELLLPTQSIQIGYREGDECYLGFPERFPYVTEPHEKVPEGVIETLKVIVTTHPTDFCNLAQESVRSTDKHKMPTDKDILSELQKFFNLAYHGIGDWSTWLLKGAKEEWTTIERQFYLLSKQLG
ncbi:MAG: caspase family protein [Calditrichaeota bacterium]|nr:caspase family protein [Calditrichota bacterium]MCB0268336.1 caspase family protein [Calditrichota bacterium]